MKERISEVLTVISGLQEPPFQGVPSGLGVLEGFYFLVEGSWGCWGFQPPKVAKMVEKNTNKILKIRYLSYIS